MIEDPGDSSQQADKQAGDGAAARVASHAPGKECNGDGPDSSGQGRMPADHAKTESRKSRTRIPRTGLK